MALSPDQRALLELRERHGLDDAEIAEAVGISSAEVRDRLGRALEDRAAVARWRPSLNALIWATASVLLVLAVLAFAGVFDGGKADVAGSSAPANDFNSARGQSSPPTTISLSGPGAARGTAEFGVRGGERPYLELRAVGIPRSARGVAELVWIDNGSGRGLPVPKLIRPGRSGTVSSRIQLDQQLVPVLDAARAIDLVAVDASSVRSLRAELGRAGSASAASLPRRPGRLILSGSLPG